MSEGFTFYFKFYTEKKNEFKIRNLKYLSFVSSGQGIFIDNKIDLLC